MGSVVQVDNVKFGRVLKTLLFLGHIFSWYHDAIVGPMMILYVHSHEKRYMDRVRLNTSHKTLKSSNLYWYQLMVSSTAPNGENSMLMTTFLNVFHFSLRVYYIFKVKIQGPLILLQLKVIQYQIQRCRNSKLTIFDFHILV